MGCEFKPNTDEEKFPVCQHLPTPVHPAHVDYLLVVSPGKLTHSQAKVNQSRRNSHTKEEEGEVWPDETLPILFPGF